MTFKDLEKNFDFSGSTTYHHIPLLTRAGAVKIRNEGKIIYYSINKKYFNNIRNTLKNIQLIKEKVIIMKNWPPLCATIMAKVLSKQIQVAAWSGEGICHQCDFR